MKIIIARSPRNSNTRKHGASLRSLGYEVTEGIDHFEIEATIVAHLDLTGGLEPLFEMVRSRAMLTYQSKVKFTTGETVSGLKMCWELDRAAREHGIPCRLSCLVGASSAPTTKATPALPNPEWEAFMASLR